MNSQTPRTDALKATFTAPDMPGSNAALAALALADQLEHELAAVTAERDAKDEQIWKLRDSLADIGHERDRLREALEGFMSMYESREKSSKHMTDCPCYHCKARAALVQS